MLLTRVSVAAGVPQWQFGESVGLRLDMRN